MIEDAAQKKIDTYLYFMGTMTRLFTYIMDAQKGNKQYKTLGR